MKTTTPTTPAISTALICRVSVDLDWLQSPNGDILGHASHTVSSDDLDEGNVDGPSDGESFEIGLRKFRLGAHDYSTDDGLTTCTAAIYEDK